MGLRRNQFISVKSVKFCFKGNRLNDRKYNTHDILMLQLISCRRKMSTCLVLKNVMARIAIKKLRSLASKGSYIFNNTF